VKAYYKHARAALDQREKELLADIVDNVSGVYLAISTLT